MMTCTRLGKQFMDDLHQEWQQEPESKCGGPGGDPGPCPGPGSNQPATGGDKPHGSPELHAKATSKAKAAVELLKQLPAKAAGKIKQKVSQKYEQLKGRYGKAAAIAILAAGIAGTATPVPGGGLLAAAPVMGVCELYLAVTGGHKALSFPAALLQGKAAGAKALDVPDVRQSDAYDCGAAATDSVCSFFQVGPDSEAEFIALLNTTPSKGTSPDDILRVLDQLHLTTHAKAGLSVEDLAMSVDSGAPVLCPIQAGTPEEDAQEEAGHWVVVCGVDDAAVTVQDPVEGRRSIPLDNWEANWHDRSAAGEEYDHYGISVSKPRPTKRLKSLKPLALLSQDKLHAALTKFFQRQGREVGAKAKSLDLQIVTKATGPSWFDLKHWTQAMYEDLLPTVGSTGIMPAKRP